MKRMGIAFLCLISLISSSGFAGVGSKKTMYVGGTVAGFKGGEEGASSAQSETMWVFEYKKQRLEIPYEKITELEYGQKAGRRVAVAILVTPFALFSKKRKHYLTIAYTDASGKQQAGVFELGKDVIRTMLASLEARTGKEIQYQDEEARKSGRGN